MRRVPRRGVHRKPINALSLNYTALAIAPKIELAEYARFPGGGRRDATFGLRVAPTANIAEGVTITLEGQATAAISTVAAHSPSSHPKTPANLCYY